MRLIKANELILIEHLVMKANLCFEENSKQKLLVEEMKDGGMGSLTLYPYGNNNVKRQFGKIGSEYEFRDTDGVVVIASLILDKEGKLFELDMWKGDGTPLIELPQIV